jgi:hypothetical protein|tara:strand:+ start:1106 stop:1372 length:267 start_codon:yes stop_codon:yes gene_type:complete
MGKISSYSNVSSPALTDDLIGTDVSNSNATKNFSAQQLLGLLGGPAGGAVLDLPSYPNNAIAIAAGLSAGQLYKVNDGAGNYTVAIVV